jgi:hypothetical protein
LVLRVATTTLGQPSVLLHHPKHSAMNFLEAQKPIVKLLTFYGFFVFKCDSTLASSRKLKLYCLFAFVFSFIQFFLNGIFYVATFNDFLKDDSKVTQFCFFLEMVVSQFLAGSIVFSTFGTKDDQIEFLGRLIRIEEELSRFPFTGRELAKFHKNLRVFSWLSIMFTVSFFVSLQQVYMLILMRDEDISHVIQASNYLFYSAMYFNLNLFVSNLVKTVRKLFEVINLNLEASEPPQ